MNAMYDSASGGGDVWINENRFRIIRKIGDDGSSASVFLVKEIASNPPISGGTFALHKVKNPSHVSDDGTYAMKKVNIQTEQKLDVVRHEINVSSMFNHPNLLPLLDHAIIPVKSSKDNSTNYEAYLLFPVHLDGTLLDIGKIMQSRNEFFDTLTVLQLFRQLCAGLKHMHDFDPPYFHGDVKTGNILITQKKTQTYPIAILMDFGSATPAKMQIRTQSEALQLQEWASKNSHAPFRAPELWNCSTHADIDQRIDIWSLGCTFYAIMYGVSPFEYVPFETEEDMKVAITTVDIKWPSGPDPPYPESLRQFVKWMLQPQPSIRPNIDDIIIHVDKLISKFTS